MVGQGLITMPTLSEFKSARERMRGIAIRSPLLRLQTDGDDEIWLKLENLQPIGSFKIRCAANAIIRRHESGIRGVSTASAGNFAQGLAYVGHTLGIQVSSYVPETAARSKIDALERLGAIIRPVPYATWWEMLTTPPNDPAFVHPAADPDVLAGNGVITMEILDDLPGAVRILAPYGGGGLTTGLAAAARALGAKTQVIACETEAGAPLRAALQAGAPVKIPFDPATFITGMGGPEVLQAIWPIAKALIADTALVSLAETASALRLMLERNHVVAEGAGAAPVAAALANRFKGPSVCIVSGGHLDVSHLITILGRTVP